MNFHSRVLNILVLFFISSTSYSVDIKLIQKNFKLIKFGTVTATQYKFSENQLQAIVKSSASALIYPFTTPRLIKRISFKWRAQGKLKLKGARLEASKKGDDSYFRVGLMVSGKPPFIPFFTPAWVKLTRQYLKQPSNGMRVYFVNAQHKPGETWFSPYSSSIKIFSVGGVASEDGYQKVTIELKKPVSTVGLWLAADGDDTKSSFVVWVRDLVIE